MWIMIIHVIPVAKEYRPELLGIYWAVPWIEPDHIKRDYTSFLMSRRTMYDLGFFNLEKEIDKIPLEVFQNIHDESIFPEEWKGSLCDFRETSTFISPTGFGMENNSALAMKLIVNNEAVKIWSREISIVSSEKLKEFIEGGLHKLYPSNVAEEEREFNLDNDQKTLVEEGMLDGCTEFEAKLVATGVNIFDRIEIPPIGWYKYIGPDLGIDIDSIGSLPAQRKTPKNLGAEVNIHD